MKELCAVLLSGATWFLVLILLTIPAVASPPPTVISPSEAADPAVKAQEDWLSISSALSSAAPGETVKLAAGEFYLQRTVIVEGFTGALKGAGVDKTIVRTAPGLVFDLTSNPVLTYVDGFQTKQNSMLLFLQPIDEEERNVSVSNMTIICDQPSNGWFRGYPGNEEMGLNSVGGVAVANSELTVEELISLNVEFFDLKILGIQDAAFSSPNGTHFSCTSGVVANGAASGHAKAHNIFAENAVFGVGFFTWIGDGSLTAVSDSKFNNTFVAAYIDGWKNVSVTGNEITDNNRTGIILWNSPVYLPLGYLSNQGRVSGNRFYDGGVLDLYLDTGRDIKISDNHFQGFTFAPSLLAVRQTNTQISDNTFVDTAGGPEPNLVVAASQNVSVKDNRHNRSGQPGWTGDPLNGDCQDGPGAITVVASSNTYISGEKFAGNASGDTMICDMGTGTVYFPR